jgi:uncharacterized membrane protein
MMVLLPALGVLPFLPVVSAALPLLVPLERVASTWFDLHCHRDPARTLQLFGVPLAACARCSGIYFGLGLGALLRRPSLTPRELRLWVLGAALLMMLDVLFEARGLHGSWAGLRLCSGLLLGYPVGSAVGRWSLRSRAETRQLNADG